LRVVVVVVVGPPLWGAQILVEAEAQVEEHREIPVRQAQLALAVLVVRILRVVPEGQEVLVLQVAPPAAR